MKFKKDVKMTIWNSLIITFSIIKRDTKKNRIIDKPPEATKLERYSEIRNLVLFLSRSLDDFLQVSKLLVNLVNKKQPNHEQKHST